MSLIRVRPKGLKFIDAEQAWFWTDQWQRGEREASADIRARRTRQLRSGKEFLDSLR